MNADRTKKKFKSRPNRQSKRRLRFIAVIGSVIFVAGILTGFAFQYQKKNHGSSNIVALLSRVTHWYSDRATRLRDKVKQVKQLATKEPPPIHFEFYTALPKMQIKVDSVVANKKIQPNVNEHQDALTQKLLRQAKAKLEQQGNFK